MAALALAAACASAAHAAPGDEDEPFTPAEYAEAVQGVISSCTVSAILGPRETPLPLAASNFLLDHPDLSAFIVNRRGIAPYRIEMLGPRRSLADDGDGTRGIVTLVEATRQHRLYYGEGVHSSRFFPDIRATAVIAMELSEKAGADGKPVTVTTFLVWVKLRSRFVSRVVKALRPFLQGTVVRKFSKAFAVADQVGRLMAKDPAKVAEDVRQFPSLLVEDRAALLAIMAGLSAPPAPAGPPASAVPPRR